MEWDSKDSRPLTRLQAKTGILPGMSSPVPVIRTEAVTTVSTIFTEGQRPISSTVSPSVCPPPRYSTPPVNRFPPPEFVRPSPRPSMPPRDFYFDMRDEERQRERYRRDEERRREERLEKETKEKQEREEKETKEKREREERELRFRMEMEEKRLDREAQMKFELEKLKLEKEREEKEKDQDFEARIQIEKEKMRKEFLSQLDNDTGTDMEVNSSGRPAISIAEPVLAPPPLKMPTYHASDNIDTFLEHFEAVAGAYGLSDQVKSLYLTSSLTGKAKEAFVDIPSDASYSELKTALRRRLHLSPETYRKRFRSSRKQSDETFHQFGERLKKSLDYWVETSELDLRSCVLMEQLVNSVSPDLQFELGKTRPKSFAEAIDTAEAFADARRHFKSSSDSKAWKDKNQANPTDQSAEGNSELQRQEESWKSGPPVCFHCRKPGHMLKDCPKKTKVAEVKVPFAGTVPGTFCPTFLSLVEGRQVDTIRDTGATSIFVDSRLVPENAPVGQSCRVSGVEEEFRAERPTVLIHLSTPYFCGKVWAVALEKPAYSLLIGNSVIFDDGSRKVISFELPPEAFVAVTTRAQAERKKVLRPLLRPVAPSKILSMEQKDMSTSRNNANNRKDGRHTHHRELDRSLNDSEDRINGSNSGVSGRGLNFSRYKTELCRPFEESGHCKYGDKCQFAHGAHELRNRTRHPKYKTEFCRTYHSVGFCPYGPRCHFIHNEDEHKINKIANAPIPTTKKALRSFLGLVGYYRRFAPHFADIAKPLTDKTGGRLPQQRSLNA